MHIFSSFFLIPFAGACLGFNVVDYKMAEVTELSDECIKLLNSGQISDFIKALVLWLVDNNNELTCK